MKLLPLIALIILLLSFSIQAQDQHVIDSLNQAYSKARHDTDKINCLFALGDALIWTDPDTALIIEQIIEQLARDGLASDGSISLKNEYLSSLSTALNNIGFIYDDQGNIQMALDYYNKSLKIEEESGSKEGVAQSLNNIGYVYGEQGDIQQQTEYYFKSLEIRKEIGDEEGEAESLNNIGFIYEHQGAIKKALEYYSMSLKIKEKIGNKKGVANSLNNIGHIYQTQGDTEKALEYFFKSSKIQKEIGHKRGEAYSLNNIGTMYLKQGDIERALEFFLNSLEIKKEIGNKEGMAQTLNNIGHIYDKQGNIEKALKYFFKSLKIREEIGNKKGVAYSLNSIGSVYLEKGDMDLAEEYTKRSLKLAEELGFPGNIKSPAKLLSKVYKKKGEFKEALEMYELHIQMRDSIKNEETQKATIRQQTKYEFEKAQLVKEQEEKEVARIVAEETSRRDNLQYSIILIGILTLFGGVLALGYINVSERMAEGIIFFSFLILFEFLLVLADPYIDRWSGGAPGIKLLFNAGIAALIFPAHAFFEMKLKGRLVKRDMKPRNEVHEHR